MYDVFKYSEEDGVGTLSTYSGRVSRRQALKPHFSIQNRIFAIGKILRLVVPTRMHLRYSSQHIRSLFMLIWELSKCSASLPNSLIEALKLSVFFILLVR